MPAGEQVKSSDRGTVIIEIKTGEPDGGMFAAEKLGDRFAHIATHSFADFSRFFKPSTSMRSAPRFQT